MVADSGWDHIRALWCPIPVAPQPNVFRTLGIREKTLKSNTLFNLTIQHRDGRTRPHLYKRSNSRRQRGRAKPVRVRKDEVAANGLDRGRQRTLPSLADRVVVGWVITDYRMRPLDPHLLSQCALAAPGQPGNQPNRKD